MPTYEYYCEDCNLMFEKSFMKLDDRSTDCPGCTKDASRIPSAAFVARSGTSRETVDTIIGPVAEQRWKDIHSRKAQKDKLREESKNHAVETVVTKNPETNKLNYQYKSVTKERLAYRKEIYSKFREQEKKKKS